MLLFSAALLAGVAAATSAVSMENAASSMDCTPLIDFADGEEKARWQVVNDGVMGGLSKGALRFQDGALTFEGFINTNGGGFSSIRRYIEPGTLSDVVALRLNVKSDDRAYDISMRSSARYRGRRVAFQAPIPTSTTNEWNEMTVRFADLKASLFGRPVSGAVFDASEVMQIGVIIADGVDGDFKMQMRSIEICHAATV
ncbi:MAG: CIA30 family protein [Pseudomonadota bacterium]